VLERLNYSISKPSMLGKFINDHFKIVWLYFFIVLVVSSIPLIIARSVQRDFTEGTHRAIHESLRTVFRSDAQIIDGVLTTPNNTAMMVNIGFYTIYINPRQVNAQSFFRFVMHNDTLSLYALNFRVASDTLTNLGLQYYDFNDVSSQNMRRFSNAFESLSLVNSAGLITITVIYDLIVRVGQTLLLVLIAAAFNLRPIPFKYKFKMAMYASTIFLIFTFFAMAFGQGFFTIVGILLMMIYLQKALSRLIPANMPRL